MKDQLNSKKLKMNNNINSIIQRLSINSFDNSFNPYSDICSHFDNSESNKIRRNNLEKYLKYFSKLDSIDIWIGRDLGYKGGRKTGIPFTSENNIALLNENLGLDLQIASNSKIISSEISANTIWEVFNDISDNIIFWNIYPFHPHEKGNQFTNRKFNKEEEFFGLNILQLLIKSLKIKRIICIGNDSFNSLKKINIEHIPITAVRHPSYGGITIFKNKIREIYNVKTNQMDLF